MKSNLKSLLLFTLIASVGFATDLSEILKNAEAGDANAQYEMYRIYFTGDGVNKNIPESINWLQKAAKQGLSKAELSLARRYINGDGLQKDNAKVVKWLTKAAEHDNAEALFGLALDYGMGLQGLQTDLQKSYQYMLKSASLGCSNAELYLGNMYMSGSYFFNNNIVHDAKEATKWYIKAAEHGNDEAELLLAYCYSSGSGVLKNEYEAVKLYQKLVKKNNPSAENFLAAYYETGNTLPKNISLAIELYKKSAEQGFTLAQASLGRLYSNGIEIPINNLEANKWLEKAASSGDANSAENLALRYGSGFGTDKDFIKAYAWQNIAFALGFRVKFSYDDNSVFRTWHKLLFKLPKIQKLQTKPDDNTVKILYSYLQILGDAQYNGPLNLLKDLISEKEVEQGIDLSRRIWQGMPLDKIPNYGNLLNSATQGNVSSQFLLGEKFSQQYDFPQDYVMADVWLNIAAANGDQRARNLADNIEQSFSSYQRLQSQEISKALYLKIYKK